ncbi:sulfate transport system ATP-binding protein [Anaerolineae bacterium]|nr:sulfate transport system ATP-binding protein [Anaerolineae bacterium]
MIPPPVLPACWTNLSNAPTAPLNAIMPVYCAYWNAFLMAAKRTDKVTLRDSKMSPNTGQNAVQLNAVSKSYQQGKIAVKALHQVSLTIPPGTFTAVMGASGSGKSTLLHLIGGLTTPSSGEVILFGQSIHDLDDNRLTRFRREQVGLIFQAFNLLPTMSALENVCLPLLIQGKPLREGRIQAAELLERVGLSSRASHRPDELSGGQQQRVAVARALINAAPLLLADEPTGNLDSKSGEEVLSLIASLVREQGRTVMMVTHDAKAAAHADQIIQLSDGQIIPDPSRDGRN